MMRPYNYLIDVKNPFESALEGYKVGTQIQQQRRQRQRAQQMQAGLAVLAQKPTAENIAKFNVQYPELPEHYLKVFENLSDVQKQQRIKQGLQLDYALENKDYDTAKRLLQEQKVALENAGEPTQQLDALMQSLDFNPESVKTSNRVMLVTQMGAEDYTKSRQAFEKPAKKVGTYKFYEKAGIINTTTGETVTSVKELGLPTQDPEKKMEQESKIRKEFNTITRDFRSVRDATQRVRSSVKDPSPAGDLALIFNYMKVLDPGSTVREGEFATATNSGSIPQIIRAQYNKLIKGTRLDDKQRQDFLQRTNDLFKKRQRQYKKTEQEYVKLAERYQLSPENIVLDLDIIEDPEPEAQVQLGTQVQPVQMQQFESIEAAEAANLPVGTRVVIQGETFEVY